jgi:hypothetical protein
VPLSLVDTAFHSRQRFRIRERAIEDSSMDAPMLKHLRLLQQRQSVAA